MYSQFMMHGQKNIKSYSYGIRYSYSVSFIIYI